MSRAINSVTQNAPGYGLRDARCLPCSGVSGRAVSFSPCLSRGRYTTFSHGKSASLKCTSREMSYVCRAGSSGYRRNPRNPRQNKHGFSQNRNNRQNDEKDGSDSLEESEMFSSKNGPLLSVSNSPKFQATSTPGPREKEIVELFRKVQAQLRERAAVKEEKKNEFLPARAEGSESVDSLLKLLRKHTTQQGKRRSSSGSNRDFHMHQPEPNAALEKDKSMTLLDSNNDVKRDAQEHESPSFTRPPSSFQRRSPVPRVKFEPVSSDSVTDTWINGKRDKTHPEPEIHDPKLEIEPEPSFPNGDVFGVMSDDEASDIDDGYIDVDAEEQKPIVEGDLIAMKLPELRALAKSRGLKGFSKLKKSQLVELLSGGST